MGILFFSVIILLPRIFAGTFRREFPRRARLQHGSQPGRFLFDIYGEKDGSPVLSTEEIVVWPDDDGQERENSSGNGKEDGEEEGEETVEEVEVHSDRGGVPDEPVELQEKAPSLVIEKEAVHPGKTWAISKEKTMCVCVFM